MGDDYEPYQWQVGDPADWADGACAPDIPYMGYLNDDDDEDPKRPPERHNPKIRTANTLSDEAWRLEWEGRFEEALVLIDLAIENWPHDSKHLNRKGVILQDLGRYEEALEFYDMALAIKRDDDILANKAECILSLLRGKRILYQIRPEDLDLINEALKILPANEDNSEYLHLKGNMLYDLGEPAKANICHLLGSGCYDEVDEAERQLKILDNPHETFISITGTQNYQSFKPFAKGTVVDLVREPENTHDRDAIRVDINGETVGYVANSEHTLINEVKSASDIKNTESTKAKVLFILFNRYIIAKLI